MFTIERAGTVTAAEGVRPLSGPDMGSSDPPSADLVPVREASTVILLRDDPTGSTGLQAWLQTRVRQMAFAAGMTVFPGGRVAAEDAELPWSGRSPSIFAAEFSCDESRARRLVGAAVRETFEETGVALTDPAPTLLPAEILVAQRAIEAGELDFADWLRAHGLAIAADALRPWARWITPLGERRRYDTHFFVAALPAGAQARQLTTEADFAEWVPVSAAVAGADAGQRTLLPPTRAMLTSLAELATVADVFAAAGARDLTAVRPIRIVEPDGVRVELPDGTVIGLLPPGFV